MSYASMMSQGEKRWGNYKNLSGPIVESILGCANRLSESTTLADDEKRQSVRNIYMHLVYIYSFQLTLLILEA